MSSFGSDTPPSRAIREALADLAGVLDREIPILEEGLDVAFDHLRAARFTLAAPWSADAPPPPADDAAAEAERVLGDDHPVTVAIRAPRTNDSGPADAEPSALLRDLQRKCTAPVGGIMSALQVRDSLRQRYDHLASALGVAANADQADLPTLAPVVSAQASGMAEAIGSALDAMHQRSQTVIAAVPSGQSADELDQFDGLATGLAAATSVNAHPSPNQIRVIAGGLRARALPTSPWPALDARFAAAQGAMDGIILGLPPLRAACASVLDAAVRVPASLDSLDLENPVLAELWSAYTVDDERDIHTRLLQRCAA